MFLYAGMIFSFLAANYEISTGIVVELEKLANESALSSAGLGVLNSIEAQTLGSIFFWIASILLYFGVITYMVSRYRANAKTEEP